MITEDWMTDPGTCKDWRFGLDLLSSNFSLMHGVDDKGRGRWQRRGTGTMIEVGDDDMRRTITEEGDDDRRGKTLKEATMTRGGRWQRRGLYQKSGMMIGVDDARGGDNDRSGRCQRRR